MNFYLKVNRTETYTYRNLANWLEVVRAYPEGHAYIQCDNDALKEEINSRIAYELLSEAKFIKTCWSEMLIGDIACEVTEKRWKNAAYAHLTTFYHAKKNGFDSFWNIDADDTCFCIEPKRVVEVLMTAEQYAKEKMLHCFSLDMHHTDSFGDHWSFGVTYTDMSVDWFAAMKEHMSDSRFMEQAAISEKSGSKNIDWFFTYLSSY